MTNGSLYILEKPENIKMAAMRDSLCVRMRKVDLALQFSMADLPVKFQLCTPAGLGGDSGRKSLEKKKKKNTDETYMSTNIRWKT